ncbi:MAG: ParB/RepB/Spo0J family partition protein [Peptococcaceae bacterium]|nr:ParB/RepB/Spo0J family partition protein [Peptococcaceae bacterium]
MTKLISDPKAPYEAVIPWEHIRPNPNQPRKVFQEEAIDQLAQSIIRDGLLQSIAVVPVDDGFYEIVGGERRWRAHQKINRPVPCRVFPGMKPGDILPAALAENLQREDLKPGEKADAIKLIMEAEDMSVSEVATRLSLSRMQVHRYLNIHRLPEYIQKECYQALSEKHARALYQLQAHPDLQRELFDEIKDKSLSATDALNMADSWLKTVTRPKATPISKYVGNIAARIAKTQPKVPKLSEQEAAAWEADLKDIRKMAEQMLAELEKRKSVK